MAENFRSEMDDKGEGDFDLIRVGVKVRGETADR